MYDDDLLADRANQIGRFVLREFLLLATFLSTFLAPEDIHVKQQTIFQRILVLDFLLHRPQANLKFLTSL